MTFAARPVRLKRLIPRALGASPRHVELTFDDGPHDPHTADVLALLREYRVRATFFVVGRRLARAGDLVRAAVADGHAVGNHSYRHDRPRPWQVRAATRDVGDCQKLVEHVAGVRPVLYRPPFGSVTPASVLAAWRHALSVVTWSLDSGDWQCRSDADAGRCAAAFLAAVRPGDVGLFHDDHPHIVPILRVVLPALHARGLLRPAGS